MQVLANSGTANEGFGIILDLKQDFEDQVIREFLEIVC